jgi:hypothetical protein
MARRKARKTRKRSTRRGMVRKTARRAYAPKRRAVSRRRRSNPKPFTSTPAFRYGAWAAGGAAGATVLNQTGFLSKTLEKPLSRSLAYAALTVLVGRMLLKGRARENAIAAGVGMVIPGLTSYIASMDLGAQFKFGNGNGNGALVAPNGAAANGALAGLPTSTEVAKMLRANPYAVANRHAARTSGLSAIK